MHDILPDPMSVDNTGGEQRGDQEAQHPPEQRFKAEHPPEQERAGRADWNTIYGAIEDAYMTRKMREEARQALNRLASEHQQAMELGEKLRLLARAYREALERIVAYELEESASEVSYEIASKALRDA